MASLYIKNNEAAALADELATRLGKTKTAVVLELLKQRKAELADEAGERPDFLAWMRAHRAANPLPPKIGEADKAFFDAMWDEL